MMPDCIKDFRANSRVSLQHVISGHRMSFDQRTFPGVETPRLIQDSERNFRLANVMKHRGGIQSLIVCLRQTEAQSEIDGYSCDQEAVLIGSLVVVANRLEPVTQSILGDAVRNFASCAFRTSNIDGSAGESV